VEDSRSYADRRGTLVVSVRDLEAGAELGERRLRLTLAIAREDGSPEMLVREIVFDESPYRLPLDVTDDQVWLGLVVDDLASGLWGGASAEL
ncbi:MAG: hypothetical protein OEM62_10315, partial [Acidobacteriota bacterium]|nr:hypothetical protein [Acidobacteriota bacterium]